MNRRAAGSADVGTGETANKVHPATPFSAGPVWVCGLWYPTARLRPPPLPGQSTAETDRNMDLRPASMSFTPGAAGQPLLRVAGFHKVYGQTVAVSGLDFELGPGDIVGLVGPNGAGKTTTMRAIAGIIPPTRGRVWVAGHDVASEPVAAKRELAYVPDDPKLFDALTVREHLDFIASAYRVADHKAKGAELLERFELTFKADALAMELSRGMRQKVAVCCAYLHDPRVVLLDEPLTGLDPRAIRTMNDTIRERAAAGAAFLVSSHLLDQMENLCNKLLLLKKGQKLFFGPLEEARSAFGGAEQGQDASLQDVFFRSVEGEDTTPAQASVPVTPRR
jgi:ABC-2 type transport system ATP-binding protein